MTAMIEKTIIRIDMMTTNMDTLNTIAMTATKNTVATIPIKSVATRDIFS